MHTLREMTEHDLPALAALAAGSGLFAGDELSHVLRRAAASLAGDESLWLLATAPDLLGAVYAAPEAMSDRVWNILMVIVSPLARGRGLGRTLLQATEARLGHRASALIVETASGDDYAHARHLYAGSGFREVARLPDFYGQGHDKVVFHKPLPARAPTAGS